MSTFGVLPEGLVAKTIQDVLNEMEAQERQVFGPAIDTTADSVLGQLNGIVADQIAELWEVAQAVRAATNPDFASGESLDAVSAITGTVRLPAVASRVGVELLLDPGTSLTPGRQIRAGANGDIYQTLGTIENLGAVPALIAGEAESADLGPIPGNAYSLDTIVTPVSGWDAQAAVVTQTAEPFKLANNQTLNIQVATGVTQTVTFLTGDFASIGAALAAEIATKINAATTGLTATALTDGTVELRSDTVGTGSQIEVQSGTANPALAFPTYIRKGFNVDKPAKTINGNAAPYVLSNGLTLFIKVDGGGTQTVTFLTGDFVAIGAATAIEVALKINASTTDLKAYALAGKVQIEADSVGVGSTIEITGGTANTALGFPETEFGGSDGDAVIGRNTETDSDFRIRRLELLAVSGAGTFESIRARVRAAEGVEASFARENVTDSTDVNGLPPHSFEVIAQGGTDEAVAQAIFDTKPAGIQTHRDPGANGRTIVVVDSQGENVDINFTRPVEVPIYIEIDVDVTAGVFGGGDQAAGEQAVKESLVALGDTLNIGDDVIALRFRAEPLEHVAGVVDVPAFLIDDIFVPVSGTNIVVGGTSRATFSTADIVVNVNFV